jgi:hypothetical protein
MRRHTLRIVSARASDAVASYRKKHESQKEDNKVQIRSTHLLFRIFIFWREFA